MDRDIFQATLPDGGSRYYDPLAVGRRLIEATKNQLAEIVDRTQAADVVVQEVAFGRLADACIAAFQLPPFDPATGLGTLESESLAVYEQYAVWLNKKKVNTGDSATGSPPTAASPTDPSPTTSSWARPCKACGPKT